jgi:hypothetical protein
LLWSHSAEGRFFSQITENYQVLCPTVERSVFSIFAKKSRMPTRVDKLLEMLNPRWKDAKRINSKERVSDANVQEKEYIKVISLI